MYSWKMIEETMWFVGTAVLTTVAMQLSSFSPDAITDYHAWLIGIGAASVRAGFGALLAFMGKNAVDPSA